MVDVTIHLSKSKRTLPSKIDSIIFEEFETVFFWVDDDCVGYTQFLCLARDAAISRKLASFGGM
uniref:Uncharacterized protein n=1 Tax=Romanomermis culicivorax TaxID=13658 RepID=A0A915I187_ROMCU